MRSGRIRLGAVSASGHSRDSFETGLTRVRLVFDSHSSWSRTEAEEQSINSRPHLEAVTTLVIICYEAEMINARTDTEAEPNKNRIEAIKFRLEQMVKSSSELSKILGARSRQSEILSGKRKLSLSMIRKLHESLNIPAKSLIGAY